MVNEYMRTLYRVCEELTYCPLFSCTLKDLPTSQRLYLSYKLTLPNPTTYYLLNNYLHPFLQKRKTIFTPV